MKVGAPDWAMLILCGIVLWVVMLWHRENDPRPATTVTASAPRTTVHSTTPNPNHRDLGESRELIRAVSETYDVPSGIIYGIWMKESNGLRTGFGTGAGWYPAPGLVASGGRCLSEYNAARCARWWQGLQAICNQRRNGAPICNPDEVRTSYAYAMGPMQVLPSVVLDVHPDGTTSWTANAVDFDRDGVIDPHSLPDAMAIAALEVRHRFERASATASPYDAWITAANGYYGSQTEGYYEGTTAGRRGIQDYWRQWCEMPGNCRSGDAALAAR
ncbi:MAG: Transglycosylase domain [Candidatus Parcubacteria bacterium]